MNLSELNERYEKVRDELVNLNSQYWAHMQRNTLGNTIDEDAEFYKTLSKLELKLQIKKDERDSLVSVIRKLMSQSLYDELTGTKCKEMP